jgi:hypothetical protein
MIGFETIGNATLICHDEAPILATDPWLSGAAYFGSWTLAYAVPAEQMANVFACKYIWLSHGHPDHLDTASLHQLRDKTILLPDHVGQRIYDGLLASGYDVHIIKDGEWLELSKHIKVMCLADYNQDATLLVDINGRLIVNFNDAKARGWEKVVRNMIRQYNISFMLKLFGYGDADMINIILPLTLPSMQMSFPIARFCHRRPVATRKHPDLEQACVVGRGNPSEPLCCRRVDRPSPEGSECAEWGVLHSRRGSDHRTGLSDRGR